MRNAHLGLQILKRHDLLSIPSEDRLRALLTKRG